MANQEKQEKFTPPPPNIAIRTMKGDEEALRTGGGQIPPPTLPIAGPVPPPVEEPFLAVDIGAPPPPAPPPITPAHKVPEIPGVPETEVGKHHIKGWVLLSSIAVAVVLLAVAGYFGAPLILPKPRLAPSPVITPLVEPSPLSAPAIIALNPAPEKQAAGELPSLTPVSLLDGLKNESKLAETAGTLKTITFTRDQTPLKLEEFLDIFVSNAPPSFLAGLSGQYLAAIYYVKDIEPHAAVVFSLQIESVEGLKALLKSWESTSLEKDFSLIFLEKTIGKKKTAAFQDATFGGAAIRYVNYELPVGFAFDYAFLTKDTKNYLIITTSRDSLFELIKRLQ